MLDRKIVVLDVGCRWGFAEDFLSDAESFSIFGFDPDQDECERLNALYASPDIKAIPVALGSENAERQLFLTSNPACSSLYRPDPSLASSHTAFHCQMETGQCTIQVHRLDEWAAENDVKNIDYLKIDAQGSELDILHGAGELLDDIRCIQAEVMFNPMYLGQPLFADIDGFLRSKGFVLWRFAEVTHYSKNKAPHPPINTDMIKHDDWSTQTTLVYAGQIFWGNAYYVNASALKADVTKNQRTRDEILFSSLGLPDVLGDQQDWSAVVATRIEKFRQHARESLDPTATALALAQSALARASAIELELSQARDQLQAVRGSASWRITAPLRGLGRGVRSLGDPARPALRIGEKLEAGAQALSAGLIALIDKNEGLRPFLVRLARRIKLLAPAKRLHARLLANASAPTSGPSPSAPGEPSTHAARMHRRMKRIAEARSTTK